MTKKGEFFNLSVAELGAMEKAMETRLNRLKANLYRPDLKEETYKKTNKEIDGVTKLLNSIRKALKGGN